MKLTTCTTISALLILMTAVDCIKNYYVTPSISGSKATVADGWISSCAVAEEGVPVCRDPEETFQNYRWSMTRTPYPQNGFNAVKGSARSGHHDPLSSSSVATVTEKINENKTMSNGRKWPQVWWLFGGFHPKRTRVDIKTSTVHRDTSTSAWHKTIVTYLMKGCSPTEVPFDLSPCSANEVSIHDSSGSGEHVQQSVVISTTRVIYYVPPSTDEFYSTVAANYDLPSVLV